MREAVVALWRLLDDIDTLDDACNGDNAAFRNRCYEIQRKRFDIISGEQFDILAQEIESGANAAANSPALCTEASPTRTGNTIGDGNHG